MTLEAHSLSNPGPLNQRDALLFASPPGLGTTPPIMFAFLFFFLPVLSLLFVLLFRRGSQKVLMHGDLQ